MVAKVVLEDLEVVPGPVERDQTEARRAIWDPRPPWSSIRTCDACRKKSTRLLANVLPHLFVCWKVTSNASSGLWMMGKGMSACLVLRHRPVVGKLVKQIFQQLARKGFKAPPEDLHVDGKDVAGDAKGSTGLELREEQDHGVHGMDG